MALTRAQIQTAFQNSLGRAASTSEENSFFNVSQSGALSDAQVITTISNSQEANLNADPVVRFYQAAFGRVPDQAGLDGATDFVRVNGATAATYQALANGFVTSTEFTNRFGAGTTVDAGYVQALYVQILGRQGSAAEIAGYTSGSNGFTTRGQVLYAISQSQEAIGISDTAVNGFLQNAAQGQAVYTGTLFTAGNGQATPPGSNTGSTFNLTTNVDTLTGTAGNDTFNAILGDVAQPTGQAATLNTFDNLQGGNGTDTLNILVTAGATTLPASTTITGIETINISQTQGTALTAPLDASIFQGATAINQIGDAIAVNNVAAGQTIGFSNTAVAIGDTVAVDAGVTSASVSLTNIANAGTVAFNQEAAGDLTSVTVSGSVAGAGALTVNTAANVDAVSTINLGITSNGVIALTTDATVVTTINASASTGNLTLAPAAANVALATFTGGSGNDTLTYSSALSTAATTTINAGAGNDTINLTVAAPAANTAHAVTLTGGAGNDSFVLTGGGNIQGTVTNASLTNNLVTISDFSSAVDVLNIDGLGGARTTQNAVNAAVPTAANTTLLQATTAVAGVTANGGISLFDFGGNTYVFAQNGNAALDAGDSLVQVTGVTVSQLTAANLVV